MSLTSDPAPPLSSADELLASRIYGAFWGFFVGDALGVPGHGYSNFRQLQKDYGWINDYVEPRFPHPESSLFRTRYEVLNEKNDIMHGREEDWRRPGTHFHQYLKPGDNALEAQLATLLVERLVSDGAFVEEHCEQDFLDFMLTPGRHSDTYIPSTLREFFTNYGRGKALDQCAPESTRVGGLTMILPLAWLKWHNPVAATKAMRQRLSFTHAGMQMSRLAELMAEIHWALFDGYSLEETLLDRIRKVHPHPYVNYPFRRWIAACLTDEEVAFKQLRAGAEADDAVPLAFYLALKYQDDTESALLANANLGGETCARGALIGSMLGAANTCEDIPGELVQRLGDFERLEALSEHFVALALTRPGS